jgi:hypothetical protein
MVLILGHGDPALGAMGITIGLMVVLGVVHPPMVTPSLAFSLRSGEETMAHLFLFALGMTVVRRAALTR